MRGLPFLENITIAEFFATRFKKIRDEQLNPEAVEHMAVGERLASVFGDKVAAWVSLPNPPVRATVKDKDAFLAWAKKNMPWAVETVEQVRPGTQATLLRDAKANGGKWVNKETGEAIPIDGIEVGTGDPSPRVELTDDADEAISEALRRGDIYVPSLLALRALPAGEGESDAA